VHGGRALGDLDAGVGHPVLRLQHRPVRAEHAHVCRDDAVVLDVDSGRLQVEDADALQARARRGEPRGALARVVDLEQGRRIRPC
jgi:hypothetical protein